MSNFTNSPTSSPLSTNSSLSSTSTLVSSRVDQLQSEIISIRGADLNTLYNGIEDKRHTGSNMEKARLSITFAIVRGTVLITRDLISTVVFNPSIILIDPVGSLILGYGRFLWLLCVLFLGQILILLGKLFGCGYWIEQIRMSDGNGMSVCNWSNSEMFTTSITTGKRLLSSSNPPPNRKSTSASSQKNGYFSAFTRIGSRKVAFFDVDLAKTLLLMSSALYERSDELVIEASQSTGSESLLLQADEKIYDIAENWGVQYVTISDLSSIGGSFCGVFYSESNGDSSPWIVVAIKGSSPINLTDWICDASMNREDASDYLSGSINQGILQSLFPSPGVPLPTVPYHRILESVCAISGDLYSKTGKVVNLFVTGHSLGAGISTILYARLLEEERLLTISKLKLRDAYLFGTPNVGDYTFIGYFDKLMHKSENTSKNIWRISNNRDLVAISPPGLAGRRADRIALSKGSLFNCGPVGTEIHLEQDSPYYHVHPWTYDSTTEVIVVGSGSEKVEKVSNQITRMESLAQSIFPSLMEHAPTSYLNSLSTIKRFDYPSANDSTYFSTDQEVAAVKNRGDC